VKGMSGREKALSERKVGGARSEPCLEHEEDVKEKEMPAGPPVSERKIASRHSRHGKELLASHTPSRPAPPSRSIKPMIAAVLLIVTAGAGLWNSGILVAAPMSPWVTGDIGRIQGYVNSASKEPVPNATIAVGLVDGTSNDTGWFDVDRVGTGRQVIVVDAPGYRQLRFITMISGGNPLQYRFVLNPGNGTETVDDSGTQINTFYLCGGISLIFAGITLAGALFAAQRRKFAVAAAGAIMGIALIFPIGMLTSGAALVLLLFSRGEFR